MILRLVKSGFSLQEAAALSPVKRLAFVVALGEMEGGKFNWERQCWREPER